MVACADYIGSKPVLGRRNRFYCSKVPAVVACLVIFLLGFPFGQKFNGNQSPITLACALEERTHSLLVAPIHPWLGCVEPTIPALLVKLSHPHDDRWVSSVSLVLMRG